MLTGIIIVLTKIPKPHVIPGGIALMPEEIVSKNTYTNFID
jgi:hypothetical protein